VSWKQLVLNTTQGSGANQTISDMTPVLVPLGASGATIKRMIGSVDWEGIGAAVDHGIFTVGVAVVTKDAFMAGAVPDPASDLEHDWYFWQQLDTHLPGNAHLDFNQARMSIDIRTMRRLREGYRLVIVFDKGPTVAGVNLHFSMRTLWTINS